MQGVDLNLLPVFQVLFEERRVGRAALRLNLSQSAVSHALSRLRDALGDQLFVRAPAGLVPTSRAIALAPVVNEVLVSLGHALAQEQYDASASRRCFRVAMARYVGDVLAPPLIATALQQSPGCSFEIWNKEIDVLDLLDSRILDYAIGSFTELPSRFRSATLLHERAVWIAREDHPTAFSLTSLEEALALPRVEILSSSAGLHRTEIWTNPDRRLRRALADAPPPIVAINMSRSAVDIVSRSDLVAMVPERVAKAWKGPRVRRMPLKGESFFTEVRLVWSQTSDQDAANRWLRNLTLELAPLLQIPADTAAAS